jgi:hypothetical protein
LNAKKFATTSGGNELPALVLADDGLRVNARSLAAIVPLEDLVPWDVVETEFDGLLVLDADRKLLAQDRRLPRQPLGWQVPLHGGGLVESGVMATGPPEASGNAKLAKPDDSREFSGPFDFRNDTTLQLAGIDYLAFVQRVTPSGLRSASSDNNSAAPLLVCGLIEQRRLRQTAIGLAPQTLIAAGALVAFGLFAIPFLKLRFIGERERMRQRDVWLMGASVLSATALLVLVMLDAHAMLTLRHRFDDGLQKFSASVVAHLHAETAAATEELSVSAPLLVAETSRIPAPTDERGETKCGDNVTATANVGSVLARGAPAFASYPDFEAIFLTDLCGNQTKKWMVRTDPTPLINIEPQAYFSAALTATSDSLPPGQPFKFATSVTPTTGLSVGRYIMPMTDDSKDFGIHVAPKRRAGLAVFVTPLWSVTSPVIAQPFQFVLVNRDGEVTYQKTETSFRGERFFDAVTDGRALERAARESASTEPQTYRYRGRAYRMAAVDIPSLELTLVAYYDRSVVGTLAARIFGTAAPFALGIVVSMLLGAALAVMLYKGRALEWAWPTSQRTAHYFAGGLACIVSALILWIARAYLPSVWLASFVLLIPAVIIVVLGSGRITDLLDRLQAARQRQASRPSRKDSFKFAFQSFAVLAVLAFVAWPTVIVFDDAFRLHTAAFETNVSDDWRLAETKWLDRVRSEWVNVSAPLGASDYTNGQRDLRSAARSRSYASEENYQTVLAKRHDRSTYADCASLRDDSAACRTTQTEPRPYSLTAGVAGMLAGLNRSEVGLATTLARFADSQSGLRAEPLLRGAHPTPWGVVGAILLVAAAILLVRSVAQHVLGIDFMDEGVLDTSAHFKCTNGTRWLLLRPSQETLARHAGTLVVHNLRGTQPVAFELPAAGVTLQVRGIESRLGDADARKALLDRLRLPVAGCLVLVSEIDPLHYLTQKVREACDDMNKLAAADDTGRAECEQECRRFRDELGGWALALRETRKVRENLPCLALPSAPANSPADPGNEAAVRAQARSDLLYRQVQDECGHMEPLIEIGRELCQRPGFETLHWDQIEEFLLDAAEPYYRSIWELCSREERLVLIQLAQDGLINPKRHDIVRRLARRGLIVLNPHYSLMNRTFARFVAEAEPRSRVAEWERTSSHVSWSRLGTPLYSLAAVVIAILLFTEQALLTNILAVATTAVGALSSFRGLQAAIVKPVAAEVRVA